MAWKSRSLQHLWLYGGPGCGKTVLLTTILLDDLKKIEHSDTLYFYFDVNDAGKRSPEHMLRELTYQLFARTKLSKRSAEEIQRLFTLCLDGEEQPAFNHLLDCFIAMLKAQSLTTYIALDALDQCSDTRNLLQLMKQFVDVSSAGYVKIIATGRPVLRIQRKIADLFKEESCVHLDERAINMDIHSHVTQRVREHPCLSLCPKTEQRRFCDDFGKKAEAMFQWAAVQLDNLDKCLTLDDAFKVLRSSATDLDKVYSEMFDAIDGGQREKAIRLLQAIVYSRRALSPLEAVDMMAVKTQHNAGRIDFNSRIKVPADIIQFCPGLLKIGNVSGNDTLRLAHSSVKDFLFNKQYEMFEPGRSDYHMANTCLVYLTSIKTYNIDTVKSSFPFAEHAALFWMEYARRATLGNYSASFVASAIKFLMDQESFSMWIKLSKKPEPRGNALYYTCESNLPNIMEALMEKTGADVNYKGGYYGSCLQAASALGFTNIAEKLIEKGAEVNAKLEQSFAWSCCPALQVAARNGHTHVVELLLNKGADVNSQCNDAGHYGTALQAASRGGHLDIVRLLLRQGARAKINATIGCYRSALGAAVSWRNREVVELLLSSGANVNSPTPYGTTLTAAINGPMRDQKNSGQATEAYASSFGGSTPRANNQPLSDDCLKTVRTLLHYGAETDSEVNVDGKKMTIIELAEFRRYPDVVRVLAAHTETCRNNTYTRVTEAFQATSISTPTSSTHMQTSSVSVSNNYEPNMPYPRSNNQPTSSNSTHRAVHELSQAQSAQARFIQTQSCAQVSVSNQHRNTSLPADARMGAEHQASQGPRGSSTPQVSFRPGPNQQAEKQPAARAPQPNSNHAYRSDSSWGNQMPQGSQVSLDHAPAITKNFPQQQPHGPTPQRSEASPYPERAQQAPNVQPARPTQPPSSYQGRLQAPSGQQDLLGSTPRSNIGARRVAASQPQSLATQSRSSEPQQGNMNYHNDATRTATIQPHQSEGRASGQSTGFLQRGVPANKPAPSSTPQTFLPNQKVPQTAQPCFSPHMPQILNAASPSQPGFNHQAPPEPQSLRPPAPAQPGSVSQPPQPVRANQPLQQHHSMQYISQTRAGQGQQMPRTQQSGQNHQNTQGPGPQQPRGTPQVCSTTQRDHQPTTPYVAEAARGAPSANTPGHMFPPGASQAQFNRPLAPNPATQVPTAPMRPVTVQLPQHNAAGLKAPTGPPIRRSASLQETPRAPQAQPACMQRGSPDSRFQQAQQQPQLTHTRTIPKPQQPVQQYQTQQQAMQRRESVSRQPQDPQQPQKTHIPTVSLSQPQWQSFSTQQQQSRPQQASSFQSHQTQRQSPLSQITTSSETSTLHQSKTETSQTPSHTIKKTTEQTWTYKQTVEAIPHQDVGPATQRRNSTSSHSTLSQTMPTAPARFGRGQAPAQPAVYSAQSHGPTPRAQPTTSQSTASQPTAAPRMPAAPGGRGRGQPSAQPNMYAPQNYQSTKAKSTYGDRPPASQPILVPPGDPRLSRNQQQRVAQQNAGIYLSTSAPTQGQQGYQSGRQY